MQLCVRNAWMAVMLATCGACGEARPADAGAVGSPAVVTNPATPTAATAASTTAAAQPTSPTAANPEAPSGDPSTTISSLIDPAAQFTAPGSVADSPNCLVLQAQVQADQSALHATPQWHAVTQATTYTALQQSTEASTAAGCKPSWTVTPGCGDAVGQLFDAYQQFLRSSEVSALEVTPEYVREAGDVQALYTQQCVN